MAHKYFAAFALVFFQVLIFIPRLNAESTLLYNSSDLSYLSNGIQWPVAAAVAIRNGTHEEQNNTVMESILRLFDHHNWEERLSLLPEGLCRKELVVYLEHLRNDTPWAAKMFDASGRYSSQFFFGNDYWLGSHTLCWDLDNPKYHTSIPPFQTGFSVAKVRINFNPDLTPVTRQINVGECLPKTCGVKEINILLAEETVKGDMFSLVDIRTVPGTYKLMEDPKVFIVGGVFLIVGALVIIASIVEVCINKGSPKENEKDVHLENNNNNSDDKKEEEKRRKNSKAVELLLSFSMISNGRKLLSFNSQTKDPIKCIHGLRCFSIFWIIMVHTYLQVFAVAGNKSLRSVTERSFLYQTVSNATFSVDTFFFISGLLVAITYLRISTKKEISEDSTPQAVKKGTFKFFMFLLYRYVRLTPVYLFVLGMDEVITRYTHNNSVFTPALLDHISCASNWWRNALYINNFFPQSEFCMLWTWYLANDTQFYIIGIILLLIGSRGKKHMKFAAAALGSFLVLSWLITFVISMKYDYYARVEEPFSLFDLLYDKPWLRFGSYAVGMAVGYMLVTVKEFKMHPGFVILGWLSSAVVGLCLVYGLGANGLSTPASAFYAAFGHTAWGLSIAWVTIACYYGYGGPINAVLGFRGLLPLSRMTFCAYLVHPIIMVTTSFQLDGPYHLHNSMVITTFFGNVVSSFLIATVLSIMFEAPAIRLLKVALSPPNK